jgi:hypothetical protein
MLDHASVNLAIKKIPPQNMANLGLFRRNHFVGFTALIAFFFFFFRFCGDISPQK